MGWKKVKVNKSMSESDRIIKLLTIALGIVCMAILIYGQMILGQ